MGKFAEILKALTPDPRKREDRTGGYRLMDNLMGIDDGVDTPGERLGRGVNVLGQNIAEQPVQTLGSVLGGVKGDLDNLMFEGGAMQRPEAVMGYAAAPMAPGVTGARIANVLSSGGAKPGIKAYHGSPHSFDKFEMDKIGTGEGAQAYGHGLYFAENEGVARAYRDNVFAKPDGAKFTSDRGREIAESQLQGFGSQPDALALATDDLRKSLHSAEGRLNRIKTLGIGGDLDDVQDRVQGLKEAIRYLENDVPKGSMYEVNIDADPADFLDWDAPLSAQPEGVRALAQQAGVADVAPEWRFNGYDGGYFRKTENGSVKIGEVRHLGGDQYRAKVGRNELGIFSSPEQAKASIDKTLESKGGASEALKMRGSDLYSRLAGGIDSLVNQPTNRIGATSDMSAAGIPGIKYRDAGSRGMDGAEGTRNYVVFDENLINIVRKYGIAGAAAFLGVQASDVQAAIDQGQQSPQQLNGKTNEP